MKTLSLLAAALVLAGCTSLAPDYQRPAAPVPQAWPAPSAATAASPDAVAERSWQQFFSDERLRTLIGQALEHNRDLRVAALNIERARALYRIERADRLPTVAVGAGATAQRTPGSLTPSGRAETTHRYDAGVGISGYELDFFGRVRSLNEAGLQEYLATEQARHSAQISLVAEVANAYLALAADRERQRLARETLDNQRSAYTLIQRRVESGVASQLDLSRAQTTVDAARGDLARFTAQAAQAENALALLVGAPLPPELLPDSLAPVATLDALPAGLPSQVLQRRPDIRGAEHRLQAAHAQIGAARAAFFPSITLTASGGVASAALADLFRAGAGAWAFLPQVTLPIFEGGRRQAAAEVADAERAIALAQYEGAVQRAFREVADALAVRSTLGEQLEAQQSLVAATAQTFRLSEIRFRQGALSYLEVLDAQREMVAAQQALIAVRLTRLSNQVSLYRALGGGWA
ncbi:AdeC/AdeK/OprM family multidrug efflux complex outer membrane factor [Ideonella sp. BN130291]|uniref:AdeC/AdeK/OprM family multidrug efflux complex outer membrane factor n=1 Tax=Ideonella sp. BN130291 TaxID=3112940 RepID=UPI002E260C4E|nr:AdeC/AdeK/OprM family multidrug efflux complex outer membrane factor [Ideonella sp. BN130291]